MSTDIDRIRLVYRPKDHAERRRRISRMDALRGTPFVRLPNVPEHKVLLAIDGYKVRAKDVEQVFNDALLSDAISNWGEDGPLYADTLDTEAMRKVYALALELFAGVELPEKFRKPKPN